MVGARFRGRRNKGVRTHCFLSFHSVRLGACHDHPERTKRAGLYHALNRGHVRGTIFQKDEDYEAFERILAQGLKRYAVDLFAFQWMPDHWYLVLRPQVKGEMSRYLRWITATHAMRYHAHDHTFDAGHVYPGRFKSFPIQNDEHFLTVCRDMSVERNALRAGLVQRAEDWRWGSLWRWRQRPEPDPRLLSLADPALAPLGRTGQRAADRWRAGRDSPVRPVRQSLRPAVLGEIQRQAARPGVHPAPRGRPQVRTPSPIGPTKSPDPWYVLQSTKSK